MAQPQAEHARRAVGYYRSPKSRLGLAGSLRLHRLDHGDLAFPDELFDGAYTIETLVHAYHHRRALAELRRVLRPGGTLALYEYSVPPRSQRPWSRATATARAGATTRSGPAGP